jgi:hypothetical protein
MIDVKVTVAFAAVRRSTCDVRRRRRRITARREPLQYVRSLYFLGQVSERKGDRAKACEFYQRFVAIGRTATSIAIVSPVLVRNCTDARLFLVRDRACGTQS